MFNPHPQIQTIPIYGRHVCHVIDDALIDPDALVEHAVAHADDFVETGHNAYPGPELRLPDIVSTQLDAFFASHVRRSIGARRTERMYSRLAITATPPEQLHPKQSLCHIDRMGVDPKHCVVASVLYLFRDPRLGGTGVPLQSLQPRHDDAVVHHGLTLGRVVDPHPGPDAQEVEDAEAARVPAGPAGGEGVVRPGPVVT